MKRILYLCNYMNENIQKLRNNENFFSQAANNKIRGITKALSSNGCKVIIVSNGLVNNKTGRFYPEVSDQVESTELVYCGIRDLPIIGSLSSAIHMYRFIRKIHTKKKIDNIIFYNYKPEVALPALWAKKKLGIPITVEYEDGYSNVEGIKGFKRLILTKTEQLVSKKINSAIIVSAQLYSVVSVPAVVIRGIVDEEFYKECCRYKKKKNKKFTILYAGDLGKTRGVEVLYDALNFFQRDCEVIITGKGEFRSSDPRINFKGFVDYKEVRQLMKQADVLLQCQKIKDAFSKSSFPSKLFEYIATGNTIISSAMPDVKEFAGDSIIYYDNDDGKALAGALEQAYILYKKNEKSFQNRKLCINNLPENIGKSILKIL